MSGLLKHRRCTLWGLLQSLWGFLVLSFSLQSRFCCPGILGHLFSDPWVPAEKPLAKVAHPLALSLQFNPESQIAQCPWAASRDCRSLQVSWPFLVGLTWLTCLDPQSSSPYSLVSSPLWTLPSLYSVCDLHLLCIERTYLGLKVCLSVSFRLYSWHFAFNESSLE